MIWIPHNMEISNMSKRLVNLRMTSLDPSTPRSKKDCKTCSRRRIRCDRSLPTCQKCGIRDLDCPGYETKLKWDQGIASRGKFAGRSAPIDSQNEAIQMLPPTATRRETPIEITERLRWYLSQKTFVNQFSTGRDIGKVPFGLPNGFPVLANLPSKLTPRYQYWQELIRHYDQNLASTFVWVDSFDNPWRHTILPLAFQDSSLLFAVLALAAEHLTNRTPQDGLPCDELQCIARQYRERSLQLLAERLRSETGGQNPELKLEKSRQFSTKSILATMLILCQLEMVHSESMAWKMHLRGSHTMIQHWLLNPSDFDVKDADSKFLIKETFTINVFAETSNFLDEETLTFPFDEVNDQSPFGGLMAVIRDITRMERLGNRHQMDVSGHLESLMQRLEHARKSTHQLVLKYDQLLPRPNRDNFERVIDVYHHAGIIYAHQALANSTTSQDVISTHLEMLLGSLHSLPATGLFAQDLAWPLFIASTECRDRKNEQQILKQKMEDSSDAIGFASCHQAWDFLKKWWNREEDSTSHFNWIGFARARALRGHTFFVF